MRTRVGLLTVGFALVAAAAHATPITGSATGLSSPIATLTFSEVALASDTPLTTQFAAFGETFAGVFYDPQPGIFPTVSAGNFDGTGTIDSPFSVFFTSPVTAAALQFVSNPGTSTFTARLGGTTVESFSAATSVATPFPFYGFQGITFDEILINAGGSNNAALIDNIQTGSSAAVPEPTTLLLLGSGAFVAWRHRRRA
jgi:hypothetical protein